MRWIVVSLLIALLVVPSGTGHASTVGRAPTVTSIAHRVAKLYGDGHARIAHLERTQTDSSPQQPMYVVELVGHFRKGRRRARFLSFSALANRMYVWGIVGLDAGHRPVWTDPTLPGR